MRPREILDSFNYAIEGFVHVLKNERNMRIHVMLGILIFVLGIVINLAKVELLFLGCIITIVLFAEMVNTAIEHTINLISNDIHPKARIIKDISAGAVLLTAVSAVILGYILFIDHFKLSWSTGVDRLKQSPAHLAIIALILVFVLVIMGKVFSRKGRPLRGGMPSGHAAAAFSIWTFITFSTTNHIIIILSLLMALSISIGRIKEGIHSLIEITTGALLGFSVTLLIILFFG